MQKNITKCLNCRFVRLEIKILKSFAFMQVKILLWHCKAELAVDRIEMVSHIFVCLRLHSIFHCCFT